jgi:hypothetical protein
VTYFPATRSIAEAHISFEGLHNISDCLLVLSKSPDSNSHFKAIFRAKNGVARKRVWLRSLVFVESKIFEKESVGVGGI